MPNGLYAFTVGCVNCSWRCTGGEGVGASSAMEKLPLSPSPPVQRQIQSTQPMVNAYKPRACQNSAPKFTIGHRGLPHYEYIHQQPSQYGQIL